MKNKILLLLCIVSFMLISCEDCNSNKTKENSFIGGKISEVKYSNHSYIVFEKCGNGRTMSVVHNPDCSCMKKVDNYEK